MKHNCTFFTLFLIFCFSLGLSAQKKGDLQQANKEYDLHAYNLAIKSYRKALDKDPDNVAALSGIADCYRHLGQMTESANWYKKAIQLPGVDPVNLFQYGKTLMALGEYDKALEWFLIYAEGQPVYGNHFAESCRFALSLRGMPGLYRVKKEFSNTDASDFGPAFLVDKVVFSSARSDMTRQQEKDRSGWLGEAKNQLFISSMDERGYLTKPQFLRNDLQNVYNEGLVSYSADGKWVAFTKNNFVNGTRQIPSSGLEGSIFLAEANADGTWNNVAAFPHNGSGYSSAYPNLSEDGKKMYFASDRPDGFGGYDIYVSYRVGGTWSTPENLGPVINSAGNEISPYMDHGVLYFASDWHHGLGGFDLFRAITEDGLWSKVFHLGNTVNSPYDDYSLIFDAAKNRGYFVSNRKGGSGNEDIYKISKISEDATIVVLDGTNGKPMQGVALDFSECGEKVYLTDDYGKYRFQVFDGLECDVIVSYDGYKSQVLKMNHPAERDDKDYTIAMELAPNLLAGLVLNAEDNKPIDGVVITSQAKGDKQSSRAMSSPNGIYQLDLQPNTSYIIRYSKVGFLDTHQQIDTKETVDKDILGSLRLNPSGTNLESKPEIVAAGPGNTEPNLNDEITEKETTDNTSSANTADSNSTESSTNNTSIEPAGVQEGFSVQVAALGLKEKIPNERYAGLKGIGNLYSRPEKGMKKIRVGIYTSREDAEEARKSVVANGFSTAFIVPERVERIEDINIFDSSATPAPPPREAEIVKAKEVETMEVVDKVVDSKPVEKVLEPLAVEEPSIFMVRLATYKRPEFFDSSKVSAIGKIEQRLKGDLTIMLLSGFPSLQAARNAIVEARKLGFKGAHVVLEENGKLIKI